MITILHSENHFLIVNKPAGLFSQAAPGVPSLDKLLRRQLKDQSDHPGTPFVGLPHRLDRETSGVMLIARNQRALKRFGQQFQSRKINKFYLAVVSQMVHDNRQDATSQASDRHIRDVFSKCEHLTSTSHLSPNAPPALPRVSQEALAANADRSNPSVWNAVFWQDWIRKIPGEAKAELVRKDAEGGRRAELWTTQLAVENDQSLLLIQLVTGRMHQIRLQSAARRRPVVGDVKYGSTEDWGSEDSHTGDSSGIVHACRPLALHALRIEFRHPKTGVLQSCTAETPAYWREFSRKFAGSIAQLEQLSLRDKFSAWRLDCNSVHGA